MTREEAKSCIYTIKLLRTLALNIHGVIDIVDDENCKKMIKVLEQEFCEDAISRKAIMQHYDTEEMSKCNHVSRNNLLDFVESLPPVTSTRKVGKWITVDKNHSKCSNCDVIMLIAMYPNGEANFCPNCGAKMEV